MTGSLDPWRTLGLSPGASLDEVRRAYRRLAKANHPDAAGEAALPRFLAIQAAYEILAGPQRGRRIGSRPGTAPAREPWAADPDRARASGTDEGRRRPPPGTRPRPGSPRSDDPTTGPSGAGGSDGRAGPSAPGAGGNASGTGSRPGRAGEPTAGRRAGARRRPSNRATPGSTSYDAADEEPFEPGWTGATWYGASSGTYWTINPKEYADPRKHGPEYQRRARRSAAGRWIIDDEPGSEAPADPSSPDASPPDGDRAEERPAHAPPVGTSGASAARTRGRTPAGPTPSGSTTWDSATTRDASTARDPSAEPRTDDRPEAAAAPGRQPGDSRPRPRAGASLSDESEHRARGSVRDPRDALAGPLLRAQATGTGRLVLALLGWPPLGVATATLIGESTGCGRFAASCGEVFSPGTWIVQIAIVLLLLAVPRLAAWSAVGSIVALAAAIPTAVALSAGGGSRQPETSAGVLLAVLGLAYVAGVAWAIVGRGWPWARGSRVPWRR